MFQTSLSSAKHTKKDILRNIGNQTLEPFQIHFKWSCFMFHRKKKKKILEWNEGEEIMTNVFILQTIPL